jgi:hypothetical protein
MNHTMVDLETLSLDNDALILSIGAVEFDGDTLELTGRELFVPVARELQAEKWGRHVSSETVRWWSQQSDAAQQAALFHPQASMLDKALTTFSYWRGGQGGPIWAAPTIFDIVVLGGAYDATSGIRPWNYRDVRDGSTLLRTVVSLDRMFEGTPHNALDDARHQAKRVLSTLRALRATGLLA